MYPGRDNKNLFFKNAIKAQLDDINRKKLEKYGLDTEKSLDFNEANFMQNSRSLNETYVNTPPSLKLDKNFDLSEVTSPVNKFKQLLKEKQSRKISL